MLKKALITGITGQDGSYLAELLLGKGYGGKITWDASKPDDQPRRCLDVSRAEREFGFRAKTDFREGLRRTVEWYEENRKGIVRREQV